MVLASLGEVGRSAREQQIRADESSSYLATRIQLPSSRATVGAPFLGRSGLDAHISKGAFWLTYGATLQPFYGATTNYATANNQPASMGVQDPDFQSAFC